MPTQSPSNTRKTGADAAEADTRSYTQPQGEETRNSAPNQPQEKMPHERDESSQSTGDRLDEDLPPSEHRIEQAAEDIANGLVDTDRRGVPDVVPGEKR